MTTNTINQERLLNKAEVCAILNISSMTLERRVWDGTLKPIKIGKSVRFTQQSIEAIKKGPLKTV